jgi:hypothetical protein
MIELKFTVIRPSILTWTVALLCATVSQAADPLVGTWRLNSQEVDGQTVTFEHLTLRIQPTNGKLSFAFSVPVNRIEFVSMSYTAKPDGEEADVKKSDGQTIGTVRVTKVSPLQYKVVMKGPNRPDSSGNLTVDKDGKTLTSEQDSVSRSGRPVHAKQIFVR